MQIFIMRIHPVCPEAAIKHSFTEPPGQTMSSSIAAACRCGVEAMEIVWRSSADPKGEPGPARRRPAETVALTTVPWPQPVDQPAKLPGQHRSSRDHHATPAGAINHVRSSAYRA